MKKIVSTDRWKTEEFGIKKIDITLYEIEVTEKCNEVSGMIEEYYDCGEQEDSQYEELQNLPIGWEIEELFDIFCIIGNEFYLISPKQGILTNKEIARSIMEMFESYNDSDLYLECDFQQKLEDYENLAKWLVDYKIINNKAIVEYKDGIFNENAVLAMIDDYKILGGD